MIVKSKLPQEVQDLLGAFKQAQYSSAARRARCSTRKRIRSTLILVLHLGATQLTVPMTRVPFLKSRARMISPALYPNCLLIYCSCSVSIFHVQIIPSALFMLTIESSVWPLSVLGLFDQIRHQTTSKQS